MTSPTARRDPATDEEFLAQLYKGGELLAAGKVNEAKDHLERAYQLHPKNEKAQNLLGLTYFKLGQFERASTIYEQLVNENPADPTLRVNLGLVYLKTNNLTRSVREFETATDLEPGHKKAHNYLGLALAQAGDYARAREHFVISGSEAMAEKMAKAMVSSEAPMTVKMSAPPDGPPAVIVPPPPPAVTAPPPPDAPQRHEDVQIEMMSDEEDVPAEADAPPASGPQSAVAIASQAQSLGGADGPPLPQPGFEEVPTKALHSDWGAQFGMDEAPPPAPPEEPADEMRMAEDEGPSAATSEAAVATGMEVPTPAVMTETSSDEMPLVDGDVVEATVEEVPAESVPVVMVEQNVLVPVEDPAAITEQPMHMDAEVPLDPPPPVMARAPIWEGASGEETARSQSMAEQWSSRTVSETDDQSWEGVAPAEEAAPPAATDPRWDTPTMGAGQGAPMEEAPPMEEAAPAVEPPPDTDEYGRTATQQYAQPTDPALPDWVTGDTAASAAPPPQQTEAWNNPAAEGPPTQDVAVAGEAPEIQPGFSALAVPRLSDLGPKLDYGQTQATGPFHVGPEGLALAVNGELLSRLNGLVAVVGGVDATPEKRRNRGRPIDQNFGEGPHQLQRVKGHGTMYLDAAKGGFQAIDLDDEGAYLREERVFAFEEAVAFENGRLSSEGISIDMVHLKGHGAVLLKLDGTLKAIAVPPGSPLKVPLARLVGWYGHVSPRVRVFVGQATVELTGEGYALLATPA